MMQPDSRSMRNRIELPIDPYGGPPWYPTEPRELSPEELDDEIVNARVHDKDGADTAYDMGLTRFRLPAPKIGWHGASRPEILGRTLQHGYTIIYHQGDYLYLLVPAGDNDPRSKQARIYDVERNSMSGPLSRATVLAQGYWEPYTGAQDMGKLGL